MIKYALGLFTGIIICNVSWMQFLTAVKYIADAIR